MQINKKITSAKAFLLQIICCTAILLPLKAQNSTAQINLGKRDSANIRINDTTKVVEDIVISKDAIDTEITYSAADSVIIDNEKDLIQLYGLGRKATLKYETFTLSADYIEINRKNNVATAYGLPDSTGKIAGKPEFKDATQTFVSEKMKYNFKTKKGIISAARSKQNDLYILSETAKILPDSTNRDSVGTPKQLIYNKNAYITTCNAETPHFGFKTTKLKLIPDKMAIIGPSILELGGIPTPLVIPFGLFPMSKNKQQGILIPRNYENSPNLGIGILGLGYYVPISDQINLTIRTDIYFRGTIRVNAISEYRKRYKYNGNIDLNLARNVTEFEGKNVAAYSYGIRIRHSQDATAHPTRTIGGSIDIQTNGYQQLNRNDFRSVTNNVLTSNFSYNQRFPGKPYTLAVSLSHSQNTRTKQMTINFPTVDFNVNTIFPFKNSNRIGSEKWYDKIAMQNNAKLLNTFNATDTTLFRSQTLKDAQFGIRHDASLNASFTVAKYFIVTPNISFRDYYYLKSINKSFDESKKLFREDTIRSASDTSIYNINKVLLSNGKIDTTVNRGFHALFDYNMGVSMQTKIFGTVQFRKGWLRGLRHVVTPSVNFNFTPDFTTKQWNYYDSLRTLDLLGVRQVQLYSRYEGAVLGFPSSGGKSMSLGYSFTNNFEMKYRGKRDTADKKVKLLENIYINGSYNFAADSFQFSTMSISTNTNLFKNFTNLSINASFDPYSKDYSGNFPVRSRALEWDVHKRLLRFEYLSFTLSNRATVKELRELFKKKEVEKAPAANIQPGLNRRGADQPPGKDVPVKETSILDLFDNFSINHNYQVNVTKSLRGKDTVVVGANSLQLVGEIKLTDKWSIRFGNIGYDFKNNTLTYPDLYIYRDLHCWEIGGSWQPERGTYAFFLRAKQGTFSFLSAPYNRNNQVDGFKGF